MTHMSTPDTSDARGPAPRQNVQPTTMTAWVGWIAFAGVMMVLLGAFHILQGLVAVFRDEYYLISSSGLVLNVDYTAWGWIHIVGGAVVMAAGFFVFTGNVVARTIGVATFATRFDGRAYSHNKRPSLISSPSAR